MMDLHSLLAYSSCELGHMFCFSCDCMIEKPSERLFSTFVGRLVGATPFCDVIMSCSECSTFLVIQHTNCLPLTILRVQWNYIKSQCTIHNKSQAKGFLDKDQGLWSSGSFATQKFVIVHLFWPLIDLEIDRVDSLIWHETTIGGN